VSSNPLSSSGESTANSRVARLRSPGLDLKPVDLSDPGEVGWLEALVWPEQVDRLARLHAAIKIASRHGRRVALVVVARLIVAQPDVSGHGR
jgi:hypothetical protein